MVERCLNCGSSDIQERPSFGDYKEVECSRCGVYRISGNAGKNIAEGRFRWPSKLVPGPNDVPLLVESLS